MHKIEMSKLALKDKNRHILSDIDLTLESGMTYGLLGREEISISRLLALLDGYQKPSAGVLEIDGEVPYENRSVRNKVHYQSKQDFSFEARSVRSHFELLKSYNEAFDIEYATALLKDYGIAEKKMLNSFEYHESPIIDGIVALASGKPIIILEGLHHTMKVDTRKIYYAHVEAHQNHENIIVISSSEVSEIEYLLDAVIIMNEGKVIIHETVEMILERGFRVTGTINNILQISRKKKIIHEEHLGEVKSVIMLGQLTASDRDYIDRNRAYYSPIRIQELYEHMTGGRETHDKG